jgi:hypothetical protein
MDGDQEAGDRILSKPTPMTTDCIARPAVVGWFFSSKA